MAVRKIRNSWWIDFRVEYVRYRKRSPENSRAGAEAYEATLRARLARGERIDKPAHDLASELKFEEFAWRWFSDYVITNNKPGEQENKKMALRGSLVPFFGSLPVSDITSFNIEQYKAALHKKVVSPKTINNRLAVLRKCLGTAYEWLELEGRPPRVTLLKCPPPKTDYLSLDECGLLLSCTEGVLQEMLLIAMRTGMRRGEIIGLQWSSIDWQTQSIMVRHSLCEYTQELGTTKSNRERYIPMDADVYRTLFNRKRETGYVFVDEHKKRLTGKQLQLHLTRLCRKAGLRHIGWHALRHTFASHLAMRGVPLNAVQALLGHSSITTTMRYAHLAPSTLRAAIELLNPKSGISRDFGHRVGNEWVESIQHNAKNP
jgi:integrase